MAQEIRQQKSSEDSSWMDHFFDLFNIADIVHLVLTPVLIVVNFPANPWIGLETQRVLASFIACALMLKAYDWLRLFEQTSFYILLIKETLLDVGYFLLLFIIALMMFGFPMMFLNFNRVEEGTQFVGEVSGNRVIDAVLSQYA